MNLVVKSATFFQDKFRLEPWGLGAGCWGPEKFIWYFIYAYGIILASIGTRNSGVRNLFGNPFNCLHLSESNPFYPKRLSVRNEIVLNFL